jgi:hypothetical protein
MKSKLHRRHIALLEVLIAFALTALCALPLIYAQVLIIRSERQFLDTVQLDHTANLIFAALLEKLYENKIPLSEIVSQKVQEIDPELLEKNGLPKSVKGTLQFVLKQKKPPNPQEKELMLYQLFLTFTGLELKNPKPIKYEYLVFIEHQLK